MSDCKPRLRPTPCPEEVGIPPAPEVEPSLEIAPVCNEVIAAPAGECCLNDNVERGWYNQKLTLACAAGGTGDPVTVAYATFHSTVSLEDANNQAVELGESQLVCTWRNQTQFVECPGIDGFAAHNFDAESIGPAFIFVGGSGDWPGIGEGSFTVPDGTIESNESQAAADSEALDLALDSLQCEVITTYPLRTFWPMEEFACDDCEAYPIGELTSLWAGWNWAAVAAAFTPFELLHGSDDIEGYPVGEIPSLSSGSNWAATGTFYTP